MDATALIAAAARIARPFESSKDCSAGSVAAALVTVAGKVYTGVCVDCECGIGFCAEHAAIAEMLKHHEADIAMIVAIDSTGAVKAPCGRCRELMWQVSPHNKDANIVLDRGHIVRLAELLPER